ncbi:MAG: metal-dependent transcriptional regulator [Spirochaetaceae bacterium]|nr:MAG: metal-dependent transcriptional regulator [Spirochaetaceae bacterium]
MATSTVEQYIKTIFQQEERARGRVVQMKQLSDAMAVTPGTATAMVKHLAERSLVSYVPRRGVVLTAEGRKLALTMVRRHRLIETFLEQVLGYDWTEVHEDAESLEHAVSEKFIQRIDAYLGHPEADPHGDPIPSESGAIERRTVIPLSRCDSGDSVRISRLRNDDPAFLLMMKEQRLVPGELFQVTEVNRTVGTVTVLHADASASFTIGIDNCSRILVEAGQLPD